MNLRSRARRRKMMTMTSRLEFSDLIVKGRVKSLSGSIEGLLQDGYCEWLSISVIVVV
jgi:hypothetical protein